MNILGFNPSHHGSVCLLQDGEIKYFIQEERVTRKKYDDTPFKSFIYLLRNYNIDYITWSTPSIRFPKSSTNFSPYWQELTQDYYPNTKYLDLSDRHHQSHASHAFYNSGFKKAIGIVIDGLGSIKGALGQETESIFECSYPNNFKIIYTNLFSSIPLESIPYNNGLDKNLNVTTNSNLSRTYEAITMYLGWSVEEAGKTMGLSSYGRFNPDIPPFFKGFTGNPKVFFSNGPSIYIDTYKNKSIQLSKNPKEWHYNKSKITDLEKDLAWKIQNSTQQIVGDYVEKAIQETGLKQVCCAGGYFLNCVTNYYLKKRFPDAEFYFEPIANDAGTAIGAAKFVWHYETQDTTIRPFKSLYLGKQYSKKKLLKGIKKYT